MKKLTLNEAFDLGYMQAYNELVEEVNSENINRYITSLNESLEHCNDSLMTVLDLMESSLLEIELPPRDKDGPEEGPGNKGDDDDNNKKQQKDKKPTTLPANITDFGTDFANKVLKNAQDNFINFLNGQDKDDLQKHTYSPKQAEYAVVSMKDMSWPEKIIFFVKQIIIWVKNHILDIIDKLTNIIRNMLGMRVGSPRFKPEDLKLKLEKTKKIETVIMPRAEIEKAKANNVSFNDILTGNTDGETAYKIGNTKIYMTQASADDVKRLFNEGEDPKDYGLILREDSGDDPGKVKYEIISIDFSHDLMNLKSYLNNFYETFDNAFGSAGEKLMTTDDLGILLGILTNALEEIKSPKIQAYEINGKIVPNATAVDPEKLRKNLILTKINTDNLKKIYTITAEQINAIAKVISSKAIQGISSMGAGYSMYSAATYSVMLELIKTIDARLKEAVKMEKALRKMRDKYAKLSNELDKMRTVSASVQNMTYTTIIQNQINSLFNSTRYAAQTVQLRLECIGMYIMELNDTRAILSNLNAVNEVTMKHNFGLKAAVKKLFKIA